MKDEYETKEIWLGIDDIQNYVAPISPRDLRQHHIDKIRNSFARVKSVEGVIAVNANSTDKKIEIIDGNHRVTAIKEWLENHVKDKIKATFHIYKNLSEEQKKAVFAKLQDNITMTKIDLVKTQCYDTFIYQAFFRPEKAIPFPCHVSLNESDKRNSIKFFRLVEPYNNRSFRNCGGISLRNITSIVNKMDKDDHEKLAQYMEDFIYVFGEPHGEMNRLYSGMAFHMGYQKNYWQGINCLGREKFKATMKKNFAMVRGAVESELVKKTGTRYGAEMVYSIIRAALNKWEKKSMGNILDTVDEVE